jgi:hypothetical protein
MNDPQSAFNAEALLADALAQKQWQLPEAWREGVLANLNRIHGMLADLQALPPEGPKA